MGTVRSLAVMPAMLLSAVAGYLIFALASPPQAHAKQLDSNAWKVFQPIHNNTKRVLVIVHGLNLHPERMDALAQATAAQGALVLRLALTGHRPAADGQFSWAGASRFQWLAEVSAGLTAAADAAEKHGVPWSAVGFSLGGALLWDYFCTEVDPAEAPTGAHSQPISTLRSSPAGLILIAPAVAARWPARLSRLLWFWPSMVVPSFSPQHFRIHRGTSVGAYIALTGITDAVVRQSSSKNPCKNDNLSATVIANPDDELVSYAALDSKPLRGTFTRYNLIPFRPSRTGELALLPRHLIVHPDAMKDTEWEQFTAVVDKSLTDHEGSTDRRFP